MVVMFVWFFATGTFILSVLQASNNFEWVWEISFVLSAPFTKDTANVIHMVVDHLKGRQLCFLNRISYSNE